MQAVERLNGMVCRTLPVPSGPNHKAESGESTAVVNHQQKESLNSLVGQDMALRLASLTKSLAQSPSLKAGKVTQTLITNHHTLVPPPNDSKRMKTEATPTNSTQTTSSTSAQRFISRHCSSIIHTGSSRLSATQTVLEQRLKTSLKRLRSQQLRMSNSHSTAQISLFHNDLPPSVGIIQRDTSTNSSAPPSVTHDSSVNTSNGSLLSMEAFPDSLPCPMEVSATLKQHLQCLESFVDDDVTGTSSDEEGEFETEGKEKSIRYVRKLVVKQRYERDRTKLGSQWAWLCHQITTLNQKLYQLENLIKSCPPKETVQLTPHNPFNVPCVCGGGGNGHTDVARRGNGSTLLSTKPTKHGGVNGLTASSSPCTCQVRQMILSNPSLVSHPVQVGDIMGYSFPVLLMDENTMVSARARGVQCVPKRKLVQMKKDTQRRQKSFEKEKCRGDSYHPHLSQPEDIASNVWLDTALYNVLQDHSYASLPLSKRRKAASCLPPFDQSPLNHHSLLRLERSKSFSPSPSPLDVSSDRNGKGGLPRKRLSTNVSSFSEDSSLPVTPTTLAKKKKGVSTPQYDINNIVIPYSILSSTARLEKLEYKEIITPKWRKVSASTVLPLVTNGDGHDRLLHENGLKHDTSIDVADEWKKVNGIEGRTNEASESEEEDVSDVVVTARHDRCETKERSRYLNFVTGNHRKRQHRPSQLSSTPDSCALSPLLPATPPVLEMEVVAQVPPWTPRNFPLVGKDLESLKCAPPPPKKIVQYVPILEYSRSSSSPSPLPRCASSTPPHHAPSPTTPTGEGVDECPLLQQQHNPQWIVNTQVKQQFVQHHHHPQQQPTIILKLSKQAT